MLARAAVLDQFNGPLAIWDFPVPEQLEEGAALVRVEMAGICGTDVHLWRGQLPIKPPVIQGAGPVGLAALAVAKSAGAARVLVIGGPKQRLELAKEFGAEETIDLAEVRDATARQKQVREWSGGYGADLTVECAGAPAAVPEGLELCRDGGRYLVLGHYCDAGPVWLNPHVITRKQLEIFGSWSSEPRHLAAALEFLERHPEFPFARTISHRFPLAQAQEALETTAGWLGTKSVIVPD